VNVVCLTGRLSAQTPSGRQLQPGWGALLLEIRDPDPGVAISPGIAQVPLVLPPKLARVAADGLYPGDRVAVVGMLSIEVEYSEAVPRSHASVVAEAIERVGRR
jgi:hypothetical protein